MLLEFLRNLGICLATFLFFFVAYGLVQLLGYRNIMCSCKARAYMERRRKGILNAQEAQNAPELIHIESNEASATNK